MRDRPPDAKARALVVELVEASPLPPPFPDEADEAHGRPAQSRETPRGLAVAATTFALIVGLAAGGWWFASLGRQTGLGTNTSGSEPAAFTTQAVNVAVVSEDGTVLRGQLWSGDEVGVIVAPGYGDDVVAARQVANSLVASGHTILYFNLRGQRPSGGLQDVATLPSDLRAVVTDLGTRGVESIYLIAYEQAATAAVVLAAEPSGLEGVAAVFAYEMYDGLDARQAAAASTAPLLFIAAEGPNGGAAGAASLAAANGDSEPYILSARPPAALSSDHFSPKVVRAVLDFIEE
ncbi:MAG: hypothetical protein GY720_11985 [bacterium]|nr:hypothetical protein [bacterium]